MAFWGDTEFKILHGSFILPNSEGGLSRVKVLGNPATPHESAEVLHQGGKGREGVSFTVIVHPANLTFYNQLKSDRNTGTVRKFTFQGPVSVEMDAVVEDVGAAELLGPVLFFNVDLVEATPPEEPEGE